MTTECPGLRSRNRRFGVGSAARKKRNRSRIPPSRPRFAVASPGLLRKRPTNRRQTPPQALPQPLRAMGTLQRCGLGTPGLRKDGCQPLLHTHTCSIHQKRGLSNRAAKNCPEIYFPKPSRLARRLGLPAGIRGCDGRGENVKMGKRGLTLFCSFLRFLVPF